MSITIGKRSFNDTLADFSHDRFSMDFRRCKPNTTMESAFDPNSNLQRNLQKLENMFPNKSRPELRKLLESVDDEIELVIALLRKEKGEGSAMQMDGGEGKNAGVKREIRDLKGLSRLRETGNVKGSAGKGEEMQLEKPRQEGQGVSGNEKEGLLRNVAEELVRKLQGSRNLDDAFNDVVTALKFYEERISGSVAVKDEKITQENTILKKAFYKQFKKTEEIEKNYHKMAEELEKYKEELRKSQNINYSLSLILKSLDSSQNNAVNQEIF